MRNATTRATRVLFVPGMACPEGCGRVLAHRKDCYAMWTICEECGRAKRKRMVFARRHKESKKCVECHIVISDYSLRCHPCAVTHQGKQLSAHVRKVPEPRHCGTPGCERFAATSGALCTPCRKKQEFNRFGLSTDKPSVYYCPKSLRGENGEMAHMAGDDCPKRAAYIDSILGRRR